MKHHNIVLIQVLAVAAILIGNSARAAAPAIVNAPGAVPQSCTEARLQWTTDQPSRARVQYWQYAGDITTIDVSTMAESHSLAISVPPHLDAASYRFMVIPISEAGEKPLFNQAYGFDMPRCSSFFATDPIGILSVRTSVSTCREKTITWQTNRRATSKALITDTTTGAVTSLYNADLATAHSLTFTRPHTTAAGAFEVQAISVDSEGTQVTWPSVGTRSFTLPACDPEVGFSAYEVVNQACDYVDMGWQTTTPVQGKLSLWRMSDPSVVYTSALGILGKAHVARTKVPGRSEPEDFGFKITTTLADGRTATHQPNRGILRMYACVPR